MTNLLDAIAAYIPRDRVERILRPELPEAQDGVALIADLSGFTPLTEAFAASLSPDQGAEELTRALETIFTPLVRAIHRYGGSVLKFSGDALIVVYPRPPRTARSLLIRRAIASALQMQQAMQAYGIVSTPLGPITMRMKIGLVYGPFRRFILGLPEYGFEDTLIGATLDQMAEAEHHAQPAEIVADTATLARIAASLVFGEERNGFRVVADLLQTPKPFPWPALQWDTSRIGTLTEQLRPYLPASIARTLAAGQLQVAELKPVVSLFVQFHGLDYDHDPQIVERLQVYFSSAQQAVERYGGRVNRLITGDKGSLLHVLFGAPISEENQEERALRAALDLQHDCGSLPFISMQRIGIAAGRVFAGPVGAPERHDYTTIGDAINLSARLMQNAADHQILLEAAIAQRVGEAFSFTNLSSIRVKGKAEPIAVQVLTGLRDTRRVRRAAPSIFGRDTELAQLRSQFQQLETGAGGIIVLTGELGMGKTLLLEVLRASVDAPQQWLSATCLAYGQQLSGYLVIDTLRDLLGLPEGAQAEALRTALHKLCASLFGEEQLAATFPYLARFMGLPLGSDARRLEGLAGEALRWRMFELLRELFRRAALRAPLVMTFDDVQWSDPTSLELIEQLAALTQKVPLLLIVAMRPEQATPAWALRERLTAQFDGRIQITELGALPPDLAIELIRRLDQRVPHTLARRLGEHGSGNPLFLVELVRVLETRGLLNNPAHLDDLSMQELGLPDSVQSLLLAQIDRLAVEARHVLQIASVIGPSFLEQVLAAIAASERDLDARLAELSGEQIIQPEDIHGAAYRFRHILAQQSAYSTLLYERRRAYHLEVAGVLERLFPGQVIEQAGLLAYHYERAEQFERAIAFQIQAADSARLLAANQEAEALYRRALELIEKQPAGGIADDLDRRARILLKLAQVRSNQMDFGGAQELYNQAFTLLEQAAAARPQTPTDDGILREIRIGVFEHGPSTLDPGLLITAGDGEIIKDLFEGLVELDADLNIIPACARRWQISEDGLTYRFELRPGLRWSDGVPLTAHDFVFAWRRNLDPATGAELASFLYGIAGAEAFSQGATHDPEQLEVRAIDEITLEVKLVRPSDTFLYLLNDPITYPQPRHIVQSESDGASTPDQIVCNGRFRVAEFEQGHPHVLIRNTYYQGFAAGNLDRVELRYVAPRYTNYARGDIDLCLVDDRLIPSSEQDGEPLLFQYLTTFFIAFACNREPFNRVELRKALAMCIDRQALVEVVWASAQKPAYGGVIPPGMPGHSPECGVLFDIPTAQTTLAKIGKVRPLTFAALPGMAGLPNYLVEQWQAQLGIDIRLVVDVSFEELDRGLRSGRFDMAIIGGDAESPDPGGTLRGFLRTGNLSYGWANASFDQLVTQATSEPDQRKRMAYYHAADRLLVEQDAAIIPLYYYQAYGLLRPPCVFASDSTIIRGGVLPLKHIRKAAS